MMFKRCVVLGFAMALLLVVVSGCTSETALTTSVTVDNNTREATIKIGTFGGEPRFVALFLTYPDGHSELASDGNSARGMTLTIGDLSPGEYGYAFYAIPHGGQDPDVAKIVKESIAVSGTFTIP